APRALHSFPTRRSSDLGARNVEVFTRGLFANGDGVGMGGRRVMGSALCRRNHFRSAESSETGSADLELAASVDSPASCYRTCGRSEEHTSELQSLAYLV